MDRNGEVIFANSKAGEETGIATSELIGKTLTSAMGAYRARTLQRAN
ncbi:MAG: hypothetical protein VCE75_16850 [Alphaproteobacteria bacterium]